MSCPFFCWTILSFHIHNQYARVVNYAFLKIIYFPFIALYFNLTCWSGSITELDNTDYQHLLAANFSWLSCSEEKLPFLPHYLLTSQLCSQSYISCHVLQFWSGDGPYNSWYPVSYLDCNSFKHSCIITWLHMPNV